MQVILTNIDKRIRCQDVRNGTILLQELKVWPAWAHPTLKNLFSYDKDGKKYVVSVITGKIYTFQDLELLVNEHLNGDHEQVALLYHNNDRVTWHVFENKLESGDMINLNRPVNIALSEGLKDLLKLKGAKTYDGITTGEPIEKSSITFSHASTIFFTCDEAEEATLLNHNKMIKAITAIPVNVGFDGSITANLTHPASITSITFKNNYTNHLTFHITDEKGNNLPIKRFFCRLTINNERLSRKNIP